MASQKHAWNILRALRQTLVLQEEEGQGMKRRLGLIFVFAALEKEFGAKVGRNEYITAMSGSKMPCGCTHVKG